MFQIQIVVIQIDVFYYLSRTWLSLPLLHGLHWLFIQQLSRDFKISTIMIVTRNMQFIRKIALPSKCVVIEGFREPVPCLCSLVFRTFCTLFAY